jgi:hypothetical protein
MSAGTSDPSARDGDPHEWFSIDVDGDTYLFDVTWLASRWTCIYGAGCPGIDEAPAPDRAFGCCSHGAHLIDKDDRKKIRRLASTLGTDEWQFAEVAAEAGGPIMKNDDGEWVTRRHEDACVFLNRPGFEQGAGCALHQAAWARDERPLDWKPTVCWQVPIRLDSFDDDLEHSTWYVREWKRRDWGEGGEDFSWWCTTDDDLAYVGETTVVEALRDELVEMVGEAPYEAVAEHIRARVEERSGRPLPHPALRRRH